ncbi:MAG TPA: AAA family ATPase, partial [Candidatus Dormibacteraeota bacterium]
MVESDAPCPLREREVTLHAAGDLLGHLGRGQGGTLFISGEAGLGKTTVLDEVCRRAAAHVRVGFGRGDRMETSLPFGLLEQALDGLGARDRLTPAGAGYALGDARAARFLAVLRWLEATAAEQPVLIALDDLHWADEDSLSLLSFLCRRLSPSPVAVLGSLRPWPPSAATMSASLAEAGLAAVEHLPPLSAQAADALLRERAGRDLPADVTGRAWRVCAGNPLLLEQVAAALARGNQVPEGAGEGWAQRADGLLLWRFAGLDDAGMRCARAASVLGTRFRGQLAVDVADLGSTDGDRALDALCRSRLVRPASTDSMEFVHPLFSQALYDDLPAPVRARLHARAFRLLVRQGRTAGAAEHAVRGDLAGDHEAVAVLERCGRTAVATGALSTGARWLEAAVDCAGDGADPALLVALADALLAGGRVDDAVRLCERLLLRTSVAPQLRGDALRLLGRALYFRGTHV